MKRFAATTVIASALAASIMFSACTPIGKMQQNNWIKKLGNEFPEDTFTYDGHPTNNVLGGTEYNTVKVKSELYPDCYISLWKENGELRTNYLAIAYKEEIYDEDGMMIGARMKVNDIAENLIQEFALITNEVCVKHLVKHGINCIYRIHGTPDEEKLTEYIRFLNVMK